MAHSHNVADNDKHFVINPATREIVNESGKFVLIQHDHNSERFTFELPKTVDGHDMSLCNRVQIHYLNIEASKDGLTYDGLYEADDLQASGDIVTFTWLLSGNVTQYVGNLSFTIRLMCVADDGTVEYAWNTAINSEVNVGDAINNSDVIAVEYADAIEKWRAELSQEIEAEVKSAVAVEVVNKTVSDGSVTWAKLAPDARHSQSQAVAAASAAYTLTSADADKLLFTTDTTLATDYVFTLNLDNSNAMTSGAEILITWLYAKSVKITGSGVRFAITGDTSVRTSASVNITERYGVCALKKLYSDLWLVQGMVEVVT